MIKVNINFLFPLLALVILIFTLSQRMFNVFPVGKLMDPFTGFVQNGNDRNLVRSLSVHDHMKINDSVHIYFDDRKVPHIYAKNMQDAWFAQGYVTASLRLWQMDFLSYVAAGRLSEIFGNGYLQYDRIQRRIGILAAAKASLQFIEKDTETNNALSAYTNGVNAYIRQLNYKNIPLEYKLMDYAPGEWTNLKSVLIMKYMADMLSGHEEDVTMSNLMVALGEEKFNKLFPGFPAPSTPVAEYAAQPINESLVRVKKPPYLDYSFLSSGSAIAPSGYNPKLGSNSWVVSGKKTKSGFPILCSDPHLNLSLPAIWLEMQITAPGMNVYGVSIPGTPAIIIGFNENIAWGISNGADDVKDWYKLKITGDYKQYEMDGKWIDLGFNIEAIERRDQKTFYDTIYQTIHGPIVVDKNFAGPKPGLLNYALRWEGRNPSNEFLAFIKLNKAADHAGYLQAISHYSCPLQNFTFACKDNSIAVNHQGRMPIKPPGNGRFILDGTKKTYVYDSYIGDSSLPQQFNPPANYVIAANQHPTGFNYDHYYNGYYSEIRANRIKQLLDSENGFDIRGMKTMQLDNVNLLAAKALPVLISKLDSAALSAAQKAWLHSLQSWHGAYDLTDPHAQFFELWWKAIKKYTWDEFEAFTFSARQPDDHVLLDLVNKEPGNEYFDRQGSSRVENAGQVVTDAFAAAYTEYEKLKNKNNMAWGDFNKVNLTHLSNIPAFSRTGLPSAGHAEAINATSANWGPSWRMIVELGPQRPTAYGIYAGGQSGNIGSAYYGNFIDDWNKGNYYPLSFYMTRAEAQQQATNTWSLHSK